MKNAKKFVIGLCLLFALSSVKQQAIAVSPDIVVSAEAAALIDVSTGRILWSHEGEKKMLVASTTKILTAIVAIEQGDLSSQVTVSGNAFGVEGSSLYLKNGEKMSLEHMLYGLMLRSGNDAATAIAEHIGGSVEGFVVLMNQKAEHIGMSRSHFVNPHGLNADDHYSTALDMARLTAYALKNPIFAQIVKTKVKKAPNPHEKWDYTWYNKNKLLAMYEGADGVKTGYTVKAGRCLVSSASRDGRQLAVVTLNAPGDWADHARLLDFGFEHTQIKTIAVRGDSLPNRSGLVYGSTFRWPFFEEELENMKSRLIWHPEDDLRRGWGEAGKAQFYLNEQLVGSVPIYESSSLMLLQSEKTASFNFTDAKQHETYRSVLLSVVKGLLQWSM